MTRTGFFVCDESWIQVSVTVILMGGIAYQESLVSVVLEGLIAALRGSTKLYVGMLI